MDLPPTRDPQEYLGSLEALERAAAIVYRAMAPTPQYAWPLLCEALGTQVWVKHENHTPIGAFKVRGGLRVLRRARAHRRDKPARRDQRHPRQPWPVGGVRRAAATGCRRRSSCPTATAARRTLPCARWVPS